MLVYIVAILESLLYLGAVPVCAAFYLTWKGEARAGVGVGAFGGRFARRMARRRSRLLTLKAGFGDKPGIRLAWDALRRLRGARIILRGNLDLGDAAATALACGTAQALGAALGAQSGRVEIDVRPTFNAPAPQASLRGMIRASAGQIMFAVAGVFFGRLKARLRRPETHTPRGNDSIKRRFAPWKDIPSKA